MARVDRSDRPPPDKEGHRGRLRQRLIDGGADALADYELIEIILFAASPRGDTKPLAKLLLERFGSVAGVLSAAPEALLSVPGCGPAAAAAIAASRAAAVHLTREAVTTGDVLSSWNAVIDYCRAAMGHDATEQFRVLFLDNRNRLKGDEVQQRGVVNHTPAYPRQVIKRALELEASALILVHNHPSGDPTPSRADIQMTSQIAAAARAVDIRLHDHIIICRGHHASLRGLGLIED